MNFLDTINVLILLFSLVRRELDQVINIYYAMIQIKAQAYIGCI